MASIDCYPMKSQMMQLGLMLQNEVARNLHSLNPSVERVPVILLTRKDHHDGWEHLVMIRLLRSAASHTAMENAFDLYL